VASGGRGRWGVREVREEEVREEVAGAEEVMGVEVV